MFSEIYLPDYYGKLLNIHATLESKNMNEEIKLILYCDYWIANLYLHFFIKNLFED